LSNTISSPSSFTGARFAFPFVERISCFGLCKESAELYGHADCFEESIMRKNALTIISGLDDFSLGEILATGATARDLAEAACAIARGQARQPERFPSNSRVAELCSLIEQILKDEHKSAPIH
jgi:hypothetical protein